MTCSVPGCKSNYRSQHKFTTTFNFPKVREIREKWFRAIPRPRSDYEDNKQLKVCIKHFREHDIEKTIEYFDGQHTIVIPRDRVSLKKYAVPCIFPDFDSNLTNCYIKRKRLSRDDRKQLGMENEFLESLEGKEETIMPSKCSVVKCKSNYKPEDRIPIFKMPLRPPELKQAWTVAIDREDLERLRKVYVCIKHFLKADIVLTHKVPNGDGTFTEISRLTPKLREGAVPCLFPGRPPVYISPHLNTSNCLFSKEQTVELSPEDKLKENFLINTMEDLIVYQLVLINEYLSHTNTDTLALDVL
ncbi:Protein kinase C-binding protein 1-like isoform X3 [Oopsacas minuta]|uniref:Protein kinase C-binding protein 1-like isoform X3 n=1 Tax=Oopsacas minuta TaxID=111878 RepID=A0AAV7JPZ6_9METZ|nr:Protein kinase C-binding protein 1-like isoform X3 [Oopsacas minuta]